MKITIDTKEDSHSEIRKIISMLNALVGSEEQTYSNKDIFSDSSDSSPEVEPSSGGVFGNLFGSSDSSSASTSESASTVIDTESSDEVEEKSDSDDDVEVVPY